MLLLRWYSSRPLRAARQGQLPWVRDFFSSSSSTYKHKYTSHILAYIHALVFYLYERIRKVASANLEIDKVSIEISFVKVHVSNRIIR